MRKLVLPLLIGVFFLGCGKGPPTNSPTFRLTIGSKTVDLDAPDDPKLALDEIIADLKPVWDELKTGNSATFQIRLAGPLDIGRNGEEVRKTKSGEDVTVKFTSTQAMTGVFRFFKNRAGSNGLEQLDGSNKSNVVVTCIDPEDWSIVADSLRRSISHSASVFFPGTQPK